MQASIVAGLSEPGVATLYVDRTHEEWAAHLTVVSQLRSASDASPPDSGNPAAIARHFSRSVIDSMGGAGCVTFGPIVLPDSRALLSVRALLSDRASTAIRSTVVL